MANCASPGWLCWWRNWWNDNWQGKPKYSEKTCPSTAFSTTNPTCYSAVPIASQTKINPTCCPDAKRGRRCGIPASNCLSYGTVKKDHSFPFRWHKPDTCMTIMFRYISIYFGYLLSGHSVDFMLYIHAKFLLCFHESYNIFVVTKNCYLWGLDLKFQS
jgi:hypothetical protein